MLFKLLNASYIHTNISSLCSHLALVDHPTFVQGLAFGASQQSTIDVDYIYSGSNTIQVLLSKPN